MIIQARASADLGPAEQVKSAAAWLASNEFRGVEAVTRLASMYATDLPAARRLYTRARTYLTEGMDLPPALKKEFIRRKLFDEFAEKIDSDDMAERRFALACADRVMEDPQIGLRKAKNTGETPQELDALESILDLEHEVVE